MGWINLLQPEDVSSDNLVKDVMRYGYNESLAELRDMARNLSEVNGHHQWITYDEGNIGDTIIKILASQMYTVDYYMGRYLDELYYPPNEITTTQQLNELLNFKQVSHSALRATIRLDLYQCGPLSPARINRFHRVNLEAEGDDYEFMVIDDYVLLPNVTVLDITIARGERFSVEERADEVSGSRIFLGESPVDFATVELTVDEIGWAQVESIFYAGDSYASYSVHQEEDGFYIYLRDGWREDIPSEVSRIKVMGLRVLPSPTQGPSCFKFTFIDPVITDDGEDITDLMRLLPRDLVVPDSFRILGEELVDRAVTLDDYQNLARGFPGVGIAGAFDWSNGVGSSPFEIEVVVASPVGPLDVFVKGGIKDYLLRIGLNYIEEDHLEVVDPDVRLVDVYVVVGVDVVYYNDESIKSIIMDRVARSVSNLFRIGNIPIGKDITDDGFGEELVGIAVDRSDDRIESVSGVGFVFSEDHTYKSLVVLNLVNVTVESTEEE